MKQLILQCDAWLVHYNDVSLDVDLTEGFGDIILEALTKSSCLSSRDTLLKTLQAGNYPPLIGNLAAEFECAPSTVERWATRIARPHPYLQKKAVTFIRQWAEQRL